MKKPVRSCVHGQLRRPAESAEYICFPEYYFDPVRQADGLLSRGAALDDPLIVELKTLAHSHRIGIAAGIAEK